MFTFIQKLFIRASLLSFTSHFRGLIARRCTGQ